jgi:hypothetical protein
MNECRRGSTRIMVAVAVPWLIRWALLQDHQHRFRPPGVGEKIWIHVVCPEPSCTNDRWITKYEPTTVKQCGRHDGPRVRMVLCRICQQKPGFHNKQDGML